MRGTVMLDLDGVVYPFSTAFKAWAETEEGRELPIIDNWNFYRKWGWHDEFFVSELKRFASDGGFASHEPLDGSVDLTEALAALELEMVVVTDRPAEGHASTRDWVSSYLPRVSEVMFDRDKAVFMKGREGPFWGLDDKIENVERLLGQNVDAWLLTRAWNEGADLPRVSTLQEFYYRVIAED